MYSATIPYLKATLPQSRNELDINKEFHSVRYDKREGTYWLRVKITSATCFVQSDGTIKSLDDLLMGSDTYTLRVFGKFSIYKFAIYGMNLTAQVIQLDPVH